MRLAVVLTAVAALAAVPCAWDMPPGETPPISALFAPASRADVLLNPGKYESASMPTTERTAP